MRTTDRKRAEGAADAPLLPRIARGDHDAVDACLGRYGSLVWSVARRFMGQEADAEDAVQDIFADLWSSADRFDPSRASEKTWVLMVARRRLIDHRRRASRRQVTTELVEEPAGAPETGAGAEDRDDLARARQAIAELRPEQRRVLELVLLDGLSHSAVAERLALPLGTVKTHARRALAAIRGRLGVADAGRSDS